MRFDHIVRARDGASRRIEKVGDIKVPDLWHLSESIRESGKGRKQQREKAADAVVETWALCHDLLKHIKRICREHKSDGGSDHE